VALGKAVAQGIEKQNPPIAEAAVQSYLDGLLNRIAAPAHLGYPIEIRAIRDDQPRAFGLPGGIVLVTSGLIAKTTSEAALAAIIGHEIAHTAAPPVVANSSASTIPLFIGCSRFADKTSGVLLPSTRAAELEDNADRLGYAFAVAAGYDPATVSAALLYTTDDPTERPAVPYVVNTAQFDAVRARFQEAEPARQKPPSLYH
jgi:predicted Zn-dependent protease